MPDGKLNHARLDRSDLQNHKESEIDERYETKEGHEEHEREEGIKRKYWAIQNIASVMKTVASKKNFACDCCIVCFRMWEPGQLAV